MAARPDAAVARLLRTLGRSFDGEAWHGPSLCEALDGCTAADAAAPPASAALGPRATLHGTMLGLTAHTAYHGGQLALRRRALGVRGAGA